MFLLKKLISPLFMPVSVVLMLALVGLFCLWFTRRQRTGKVLVTVAIGLLGLLSHDCVSNLLAGPLEKKYPPITNMASVQGVKWIVVLGGGSEVDPKLPASTFLSGPSLVRLLEGVSLYKRNPGSKLIVTGRSSFGGITPVAAVMADVAREWGVKAEDIVVERASKDTKDHAAFVKEIVGDDRFVLVTSASHMPRTMGLFRRQRLAPKAAPTDYMAKAREGRLTPQDFFPSAEGLEKTERAVHEYLGLVWAWVRGQKD